MNGSPRCEYRDSNGLRCVFGAEHSVDYHLPEYAPGEAPPCDPLFKVSPSSLTTQEDR